MTRKRRNHSPEFKAKVVLVAAKSDKTITDHLQLAEEVLNRELIPLKKLQS